MSKTQWDTCSTWPNSSIATARPTAVQAPVGFQRCATGSELGFKAARSYSLIRPPRTAWRLIRSVEVGNGSAAARKCRWAGGCNQPASACEVHHTKHKANGGPTSTADCVLLCTFHHQIAIHRWGWTLVLNPDGTTTAWNKDKTKVLHSHGPPVRPG